MKNECSADTYIHERVSTSSDEMPSSSVHLLSNQADGIIRVHVCIIGGTEQIRTNKLELSNIAAQLVDVNSSQMHTHTQREVSPARVRFISYV